MSIFVFRGNRQKWNIIFGIHDQLMEKHVLAFYKDNKEREKYKRKVQTLLRITVHLFWLNCVQSDKSYIDLKKMYSLLTRLIVTMSS